MSGHILLSEQASGNSPLATDRHISVLGVRKTKLHDRLQSLPLAVESSD